MVDAKLIFGVLGNAVTVLMFLSPVTTFWIILKNKSTQSFSGIPYIFLLLNCLLWVLYGTPFVAHGAMLVLTVNGIGVALQAIFITLFVIYSHKHRRKKQVLLLAGVLVTVVTITSITLFVLKELPVRQRVVGSICVALNIAMYSSPLAVMKLVIQTKSVAFMPFYLSFFIFINSALWSGYGVAAKDIYLLIPNLLGVFFGAVQLALQVIYRDNNKPPPLHLDNKPPPVDLEAGSPIGSPIKSASQPDAKTVTCLGRVIIASNLDIKTSATKASANALADGDD